MTPREIIDRWTARREEWARLHAMVDGAALAGEVLADLERVTAATEAEALTLSAAADRSGYTADHLSRLIRQGKLTNVGRPGAPRVLAGDLPQRARTQLAHKPGGSYDGASDARLLRVRR